MLVATPGGHLTELKAIARALEDEYSLLWLSYRTVRTVEARDTILLPDPGASRIRIMLSAVRLFVLCLKLFVRLRPVAVLSTGSIIALPVFVVAKLNRVTSIYVESVARIRTRSLTGRLLYPLATHFLVQDPGLVDVYGDKACYAGALL